MSGEMDIGLGGSGIWTDWGNFEEILGRARFYEAIGPLILFFGPNSK